MNIPHNIPEFWKCITLLPDAHQSGEAFDTRKFILVNDLDLDLAM